MKDDIESSLKNGEENRLEESLSKSKKGFVSVLKENLPKLKNWLSK